MHVRKTKGLSMIPPNGVSSAAYVPLIPMKPQVEVAQLYANHRRAFAQFDFASPLLALMRMARNKGELSGPEKREWVLIAFRSMVDSAYETEPLRKQIANASAVPLLEAFYTIAERSSLFIRDYSVFHTYSSSDPELFVNKLAEVWAPNLKQGNIIPMLEIIYWMKFYYLRNQNEEVLSTSTLDIVFPKETDMKTLYFTLATIIFKALHEVSESYISLKQVKPPKEDCCGCVFM
jgi:hypothetical protein